jgi:hypothetical protein
MRIFKLHRRAAGSFEPPTPRRSRRIVVVGASVLAMVLATTGIVAAMSRGSSPATQDRTSAAPESRVNEAPASPAAKHSSGRQHKRSPKKPASPSLQYLLADGTYPTYVHDVNVQDATITVDVIQVFEGEDAAKTAIEDGMSPDEAQYLYVYVRNQNPLLRTLPVAADVVIDFLGNCETPPDRTSLLKELAKRTTPFTTGWYYDIAVVDGVIHHISQKIAEAAC